MSEKDITERMREKERDLIRTWALYRDHTKICSLYYSYDKGRNSEKKRGIDRERGER